MSSFKRGIGGKEKLGLGPTRGYSLDVFNDIIITSIEGGSDCWAMIIPNEFRMDLPPPGPECYALSERIAKALHSNPNFFMNVYDAVIYEEYAESSDIDFDDSEALLGRVTTKSMVDALEMAKLKYPDAYNNIMNEESDAVDCDTIFQLATMGEIVF